MGESLLRQRGGKLLRVLLITGFILEAFSSILTVQAAAALTVTPLTWNIVGLDSNNVNAGPNLFPMGARVCNNGDTLAEDVISDFHWGTPADGYVNLRSGTREFYHEEGIDLAPEECLDFYYEVEVTRNASAYNHRRPYSITAAANGVGSVSSPEPREIFVERLVSQNRNTVSNIYLDGVSIPNGGSLTLSVGETYDIMLEGSTSTNGYNQLESFISLPNTIFRINSVKSYYTVSNLSQPHKQPYADSCGWDNDPRSPTYRSCVLSDGKTGGTVKTNYNVTVMSGTGSGQTLNTMLYDFSGSSYHYNSDFSSSSRIVTVISPFTFSKSFSPVAVSAGGTTRLTFTLENSSSAPIDGVSFSDALPALPAQMVVAGDPDVQTAGCGSPTFEAAAGTNSISFSAISIPGNGACTASVQVSVPASPAEGVYANTAGPIRIDGNDTGLTASANLTVSQITPAGSCSAVLASWTFPSGTTIPNPAYTTKAADVTVAAASVSSALTGNESIATIGSAAPNSWQARGAFGTSATFDPASDQYFLFQVDTSKYANVKLNFNYVRGSSGPTSLHVYSGPSPTPPQNEKTSYTVTTGWLPSGEINFSDQTSTTGSTYFFLYGNYAANNGANSTLNIDDVTFTGCQAPQSISKSFTPDVVAVGGVSRLEFTLTNSNAAQYTGVRFTDTLPAGLLVANPAYASFSNCGSPTLTAEADSDTITFTGGTLAPASSCTVGVDVVATAAGSFKNVSGYISSTEGGTNTSASGYASATLAAVIPPSFEKRFSPNPVYSGDQTELIFTIRNPNSAALEGLAFTDNLPGSLLIGPDAPTSSGCDDSSLHTLSAAAGTAAIDFSNGSVAAGGVCTVTVPVSAPSAGVFENTSSTLTTAVSGISAPEAIDTLVVKDYHPEIQLSKQISENDHGPWASFALVPPGTPLYYRLTVENTGDVALSNVVVSDPLVDLSGCTAFTNPLTLTVAEPEAECIVGPVAAQEGGFFNRAAVEATYLGATYSASASAEYIGAVVDPDNPGLDLTKQISASPVGPWTTAITDVAAESPVYYKFTLLNSGNSTLTGLTITDPLIDVSACSFIDPLISGAATVCITGPEMAADGVLTNTASASSSSPSVASGNSSASYASGIYSISGAVWEDANGDGVIDAGEERFYNASLLLYQDDGDAVYEAGVDLFLGAQYTNSEGDYTFGALPAGSYFVVSSPIGGYQLTSGGSPRYLTLSANSSANDFGYQLIQQPDLTLSKTNDTGGSTPTSAPFVWSLTVNNLGGGDAVFAPGDVLLTDTLPAEASYDQIVTGPANLSCALDAGVLTCTVITASLTIPASSAVDVVSYRATPSAAASLRNAAMADPGGVVLEINEDNNTRINTVDAVAPPSISKSFAESSIFLNATTTLTYTITNPNATIALVGVAFTDLLPDGLEVSSSSTTECGGALTITALHTIALSGGNLSGGATCTFDLTITGSAEGLQESTSSAVTSTNGGSGNTASDSITVLVPVYPADLSLVKSHTGSFVRGSTGSYTLVVSNGAGAGATAGIVTVSDPLPAGLTLNAAPSGAGWTCSGLPGAGAFSCTRSDALAAAASYPAITAVVNVALNAPASITNTASVSGGGDASTATSTDQVAINSLPAATPDANTAQEGGPAVSQSAAAGLLANDSLGDEPTNISAAQQGSSPITLGVPRTTAGAGTLTLYVDGSYSYTPPASGSVPPNGLIEVFTYTIRDKDSDTAASTLTITVVDDNPGANIYQSYIPIAYRAMEPAAPIPWDLTLGYEDLSLRPGLNDYDYNDWTVTVAGANHTVQGTNNTTLLKKLSLSFAPKARGGAYSHTFQVQFPAGAFASSGTATLTLYDRNHTVIAAHQSAFVNSTANTFTIFSNTAEVLPGGVVNTNEKEPLVSPQRFATLTIEFNTPFAFTVDPNRLSEPHGAGLFFDPILIVHGNQEQIHRGDVRFLSIPADNWLWPEERVRLDRAYPRVAFNGGSLPEITFPAAWWQEHTDCVYDGITCAAP